MNYKLKSDEQYRLTKQGSVIDVYERLRRLERLIPLIPYADRIINDFKSQYFTIEVIDDLKDIEFTYKSTSNTTDCSYIEYSLDDGATWNRTDNVDNTSVTMTIPTVRANTKVLIRGLNRTFNNTANFYFEGRCKIYGNIMSLLYGDFVNNGTLFNGAFYGLFSGVTNLVDAKNLVLPSTSIVEDCYRAMFSGCTSLVTPPELPSTTLATRCYASMFSGCTALTSAPELPALITQEQCYWSMFSGCTALTSAPELPATTLFTNCYEAMFSGCTSLTKVYNLPARTLSTECYSSMFKGCTALDTAPELPAETLVNGCYEEMFAGCENLSEITAMFTTNPSDTYTSDWVAGVSSDGTFYKNGAASWTTTGDNAIPSDWTVKTVYA